ncbi:magnesium protoporphyrin IX methyltransferase [Beijerinckia sp. L45]|uniref:magnesium protoporphyrin IX methyltransferase n=1 Tax=Beijerinckia sp. L45 TaxID=1641855 RepID=UPI00131C21B5|nr:magnesium protoporphyrin IX methyltransferase [Beijerinckia sp. L45]
MTQTTYLARRGQLQTYFDRTAVDAWARLTSDAPVSRVRATVRAGRDAMRQTILDWLPADLSGARLLDAGCGTGALAVEAAKRGADVVAIDLSPNLVALARDRTPALPGSGRIDFRAGDMLDSSLGRFDYAVAMDSLIHYRAADMADAVARLASGVDHGIIFTFAPRTPALTAMHAVGKLFPRGDKSPAIEPIGPSAITKRLRSHPALAAWHTDRTHRVSSGFYISQALEVVR